MLIARTPGVYIDIVNLSSWISQSVRVYLSRIQAKAELIRVHRTHKLSTVMQSIAN